jgi:hypothetical protein
MFHFELFTSSIATGANTFAQLNYYTTQNILPAQVNGLQVSPQLPYLMAVMPIGANLVHTRVQSNSMLPFPYITLDPGNRGSAFESPPRVFDFSYMPMQLKPTEEFDVFASQNSGAGQTQYVGVLFSDGKPAPLPLPLNPAGMTANPATPGRFFTVHWTAAVTLSAGAWSLVQPNFDQALYAGYYALVGARVFSASALFFRLYPSYGPLWRPGATAVQAYDALDMDNARLSNAYDPQPSNWGVWLNFYQNVPPQIQIFATAADTTEEGWFDLVYLGPQVIQQTP